MTQEQYDGMQQLMLVALLQKASTKGRTLSFLLKDSMKTLVAHRWSGAEAAEQLKRALAQLQEDGLAQRRQGTTQYELSERGRASALAFLEVSELEGNPDWTKLSKQYLTARTLGIASAVTAETRARLGTVAGLRAEILRQYFDLALPPLASLAEVRNELGWHLLAKGAHPKAIAAARRLGSFKSAELICETLMFSAAELTSVKLGSGAAALAAFAVGAPNMSDAALYAAVLRPIVDVPGARLQLTPGASAAGAPAPASAGRGRENGQQPLGDFAESVRRIAHNSPPEQRFGEELVYISHVWRQYAASHGGISLADFKAHLLRAYLADLVILAKADLPQLLDAAEVAASTIEHHHGTFVFIRI